jgi:general secretion pathway protein D
MKSAFMLCLLCAVFSASALGAPVPVPVPVLPVQPSVHLDRLNLVDGITAIYGDLLKESFSIDPDLLRTDKQISVHVVGSREPGQLKKFMETYLRGVGVAVVSRGGTLHFVAASKLDETQGENLVYRLRARATSYFADLLPLLFPKVKFSFHRGVSSRSGDAPAGDLSSPGDSSSRSAGAGAAPIAPSPPPDSGTSAYSQIDRDSDLFVAVGDAADLKRLASLLAQIDVPEPQVVVHAYLYEVNSDSSKERGFSLALSLFGKAGLVVGSPVGSGVTISGGTAQGGNIKAVLSSLNADSNYKLLSSPSLRVRDGGKARFSVGSDVPVLGAVQVDRQGNPIQSVEYKPSGVILDVAPRIFQDVVSLHLAQQESSFVQTTTGVNGSPTLLKREMQSDFVVKAGDVVVLGSLDQSRDTASRGGQTWLPDWMYSSASDKSKNEVLLVMSLDVIR